MRYRTLGRTGLTVSEIGFGGAAVAGKQEWYGPVVEEEAILTIRRALGLGLNYIDTARGYGKSEEIVGNALKGHEGTCYVATKIAAGTSADEVERQFVESLKDLQRDKVEVIMVHDIQNLGEGKQGIERALAPGGVVEGMTRLREQGLVDNLGVSGRALEVAEAVRTGEFDVLLTYNQFNLLDQTAANSLLPLAAEKNVGVVIAGAFHQGFLSEQRETVLARLGMRANWSFNEKRLEMIRRKLPKLTAMTGGDATELRRLALRFVLSDLRVSLIVVGMRSVAEVEESLAASEEPRLSDEEIREVLSV